MRTLPLLLLILPVLAFTTPGCAHRGADAGPAPASAPAPAKPPEPPYDVAPQVLVNPPPEYPEEARRQGLQGRTTVEYVVGTDGRVHNLRLLQPLPEALEAALRRGLDAWRFEPARKGKKPVNAYVRHEMVFSLDGR